MVPFTVKLYLPPLELFEMVTIFEELPTASIEPAASTVKDVPLPIPNIPPAPI